MRRRLVLVALASTSMVVIAFLVPLAQLVRTLAAERALRAAEVAAQSLAPALALEGDPDVAAAFVQSSQQRFEGTLTVFLPDGSTLGTTEEADELVAQAREGSAFAAAQPDGTALYIPVLLGGGTDVAVVRAFIPAEVLTRGVAEAWAGLAVLGVLLVAGAVLVADRLGRTTVRAVRELEAVAVQLAEGRLEARAAAAEPPEVRRVATALNVLAGRIVELLAEEREAAADLSHRLRTPLTALRLDAESLPASDAAARVRDGVDDLERAIDRVIREARRPVREGVGARTDLAEVVRDRAAFWAALAEEQGRPWEVDVGAGPAPVPLLREDLEAVVDALLGNVFAHTSETAACRVSVVGGADGTLVVEDAGPGLDVEAVARGVSGRRSTGLGLDIVRRTAELTGGALRVDRSPLGGARVSATFGSMRDLRRARPQPATGRSA